MPAAAVIPAPIAYIKVVASAQGLPAQTARRVSLMLSVVLLSGWALSSSAYRTYTKT